MRVLQPLVPPRHGIEPPGPPLVLQAPASPLPKPRRTSACESAPERPQGLGLGPRKSNPSNVSRVYAKILP